MAPFKAALVVPGELWRKVKKRRCPTHRLDGCKLSELFQKTEHEGARYRGARSWIRPKAARLGKLQPSNSSNEGIERVGEEIGSGRALGGPPGEILSGHGE